MSRIEKVYFDVICSNKKAMMTKKDIVAGAVQVMLVAKSRGHEILADIQLLLMIIAQAQQGIQQALLKGKVCIWIIGIACE